MENKYNFLIVEDDDISTKLISVYINSMSNKIFYAKNGFDAIDICKNNPKIDIILMDIKMPFLDGYNTTKKIREFNKNVFIVAQTSFSTKEDKNLAIEVGCNAYISKPYSCEDLISLIQENLKKQIN